MDDLKKELDSRVTFDNLCNQEIIALSQELDKKVVEQQKKMLKGVN